MKSHTAREVYRVLGNDAVWKAANDCESALSAAAIPHAILGGVAVCLHGYQRNTVDVDLPIRRIDGEAIRDALIAAGCDWNPKALEFTAPSGAPGRLATAAEPAGKGSEVLLPDPTAANVTNRIEGLTVPTLARATESTLACGPQGAARSRPKQSSAAASPRTRSCCRRSIRQIHRNDVRRSRRAIQSAAWCSKEQ